MPDSTRYVITYTSQPASEKRAACTLFYATSDDLANTFAAYLAANVCVQPTLPAGSGTGTCINRMNKALHAAASPLPPISAAYCTMNGIFICDDSSTVNLAIPGVAVTTTDVAFAAAFDVTQEGFLGGSIPTGNTVTNQAGSPLGAAVKVYKNNYVLAPSGG